MAVDCHFHVIGSPELFPLLPSRSYTPAEATLADWRATMEPLGFTYGVVVQPSIYGTDNHALLSALSEADGALVGVAAVGGDVSDGELDALVQAGVRGLRFAHFEPGDPRLMPGFVQLAELPNLAPRLRERQLHVDLFTDSRLLSGIAPELRDAGVPVMVDHMGRTPASLGIAHEGMQQLNELLEEGWCWVKLSGIANVSRQAPNYEDARAMHDWLVSRHMPRLVWGSDWPHTRPSGDAPSTATIFHRFLSWTTSNASRQRILLDNPLAFYRLQP